MRRLLLGVDGGQSSTTALIGGQDGRVLGIGRAGPCNHASAAEGREKFVRALSGCVSKALANAELPADSRFECAAMGFSGGPADKDAIAREIVAAEMYSITHDALIALAGATAGEPGIVVIAGTGSIAFGRNAEGRSTRAGGWGYVFGDEGSAFDLVRKALRAILQFSEGWGQPTVLRDALLEATGARDANELLHRFYTDEYPRDRVAALASLVDEAAAGGDAVAGDILKSAAQSLASLAAAVRDQLFTPGEIVTVAHVGGVFQSAMLLQRFRMLVELNDDTRAVTPRFGPAAGALIEAYRLTGITCDLDQLAKL